MDAPSVGLCCCWGMLNFEESTAFTESSEQTCSLSGGETLPHLLMLPAVAWPSLKSHWSASCSLGTLKTCRTESNRPKKDGLSNSNHDSYQEVEHTRHWNMSQAALRSAALPLAPGIHWGFQTNWITQSVLFHAWLLSFTIPHPAPLFEIYPCSCMFQLLLFMAEYYFGGIYHRLFMYSSIGNRLGCLQFGLLL